MTATALPARIQVGDNADRIHADRDNRRYRLGLGPTVCLRLLPEGHHCALEPGHERDGVSHVAIAWTENGWTVSEVEHIVRTPGQIAHRAVEGMNVGYALPEPHREIVGGYIETPTAADWAERPDLAASADLVEVLVRWGWDRQTPAVWERVDELVHVDYHGRPLYGKPMTDPRPDFN